MMICIWASLFGTQDIFSAYSAVLLLHNSHSVLVIFHLSYFVQMTFASFFRNNNSEV